MRWARTSKPGNDLGAGRNGRHPSRVLAILAVGFAAACPLVDFARAAAPRPDALPRRMLDEAAAEAAGIRKLAGKHLTLYTDLPPSPEIDEYPTVFDLAFLQWCGYFGQSARQWAGWHVTGFLMRDRQRFEKTRLLPDDLPPFPHGYTRGNEFWLFDQPSAYYRRHLFLHEGTHAFGFSVLGSCGPPWYMEGVAELLATHRWQDGKLELGYLPARRDEVPMWGRIKIVRDAYEARRAKSLKAILEYDADAHRENEPYGWCWAAATFLDRHPRYQKRFRQMVKYIRQPDFTAQFYRLVGSDWNDLAEEWQVFVAELDYGVDVARTAIDFAPGRALPEAGAKITVAADRGWQNSGVRLEAGTAYEVRASGRFQVADRPQPWPCEPNGVSIRYYRGRPLGILLAAVRPDEPASPSALISPQTVGLGTTLVPKRSGTLFLRINDSNGELADNAGVLVVEVRASVQGDGPDPGDESRRIKVAPVSAGTIAASRRGS
jgi:hypothetical protein